MALGVYQGQVVDDAGNAQPTSSIEVRRESNNALAPIYEDRLGAVPLTNPFDTDAEGFFRFFASGGDSYKITATKGGLSRELRYVPTGLLREVDIVDGSSVADRTALKAINTLIGTTIYLRELGREGAWVWRLGDYSAHIAADTSEGLYVKANDVDADEGAWVRIYNGYASVKWWGATGLGVANDAPAIQAAINMLIFLGGGVLFFPAGIYVVTSTVVINNTAVGARFDDRVNIIGEGSNVTAIHSNGLGAAALSVAGSATYPESHFTLKGIRFKGNVTAGSIGVAMDKIAWPLWEDVTFETLEFGFYLQSTEAWNFTRVNSRFCTKGGQIVAGGGGGTTDPNDSTFVNCDFANNTLYGLSIANANALTFVGGKFAFNATSELANAWGLRLLNPASGSGAINFYGTKFENSGGEYGLLVIQNEDRVATINLNGVAFTRDILHCLNNIRVEGTSGSIALNMNSNRHVSFGSYTPNAARPVISITHSSVRIVNEGATYYQDAVEAPYWYEPIEFTETLRPSSNGTIAAATTMYGAVGEFYAAITSGIAVLPRAGTVRKIVIRATGDPGAGQTFTYTLQKNGADTSMTGVMTAGNSLLIITANPEFFASGDLIALKVVTSGTATARWHRAAICIDNVKT